MGRSNTLTDVVVSRRQFATGEIRLSSTVRRRSWDIMIATSLHHADALCLPIKVARRRVALVKLHLPQWAAGRAAAGDGSNAIHNSSSCPGSATSIVAERQPAVCLNGGRVRRSAHVLHAPQNTPRVPAAGGRLSQDTRHTIRTHPEYLRRAGA